MMNIPSVECRVLISPSTEEDRFLPEGPRNVVVNGREALVWVNIQTAADSKRGAVHMRYWDNGERGELPQTARPGFFLPTTEPGVVVVGREKEIGLLDLRTNAWTPWATIPDADPRTIINDGETVPGGRTIVFGTKDTRFADPIAHLYLFTVADRRVTPLRDNQLCSNGKFFDCSASDLVFYDIDTPKRNVVRYRLDIDRRTVDGGETVLDLRDVEGFPDGMVDGGDGSAIIAFYNPANVDAGKAIRFSLADGKPLEEWITPGSPRVTCPLLVEREGRVQLALTTAVEGMPAEIRSSNPNAGSLFIGATTLPALSGAAKPALLDLSAG